MASRMALLRVMAVSSFPLLIVAGVRAGMVDVADKAALIAHESALFICSSEPIVLDTGV